jgi:hypothetical protein
VAAFKLDHKRHVGSELEPDEVVGERMWAALNVARPVVIAEREATTVKDLAKESETVAQAQSDQLATNVVAAGSVAAGVQQASETGWISMPDLAWAPTLHASLMPIIEALSFFGKHFLWVVTLVAAVLIWRGRGKIIAARLRDHIRGWNLGR